ncbi:hypothetical protein ACP4OV_020916 [Aristida adscensionis]
MAYSSVLTGCYLLLLAALAAGGEAAGAPRCDAAFGALIPLFCGGSVGAPSKHCCRYVLEASKVGGFRCLCAAGVVPLSASFSLTLPDLLAIYTSCGGDIQIDMRHLASTCRGVRLNRDGTMTPTEHSLHADQQQQQQQQQHHLQQLQPTCTPEQQQQPVCTPPQLEEQHHQQQQQPTCTPGQQQQPVCTPPQLEEEHQQPLLSTQPGTPRSGWPWYAPVVLVAVLGIFALVIIVFLGSMCVRCAGSLSKYVLKFGQYIFKLQRESEWWRIKALMAQNRTLEPIRDPMPAQQAVVQDLIVLDDTGPCDKS